MLDIREIAEPYIYVSLEKELNGFTSFEILDYTQDPNSGDLIFRVEWQLTNDIDGDGHDTYETGIREVTVPASKFSITGSF